MTAPAWIPVGERLPTHIHSVWIWVTDDHLAISDAPYGEVGVYNAERGQWQMNFGDDDIDVEVSHWQPIEPPQEGSKDG